MLKNVENLVELYYNLTMVQHEQITLLFVCVCLSKCFQLIRTERDHMDHQLVMKSLIIALCCFTQWEEEIVHTL